MKFPITYGLQKVGLPLILTSGKLKNLCFLIDTGSTHNVIFDFVFDFYKDEFTLIDENKATVPSTVSKRGEKTDVSYSLIKVGSSWKIIDLSIDEESWVKTINEKMSKTLKEKGWSGVKELLNNRVKALNKKV